MHMCTAICFNNLFGRTLDHHKGYGETVTLTPRRARLSFKMLPAIEEHYVLLGMATVAEGVPLYYDAFNEHGLFMAGLLFADNAVYLPSEKEKYNVAPYELIPWILGQCPDLKAARALLTRVNLINEPFSKELPLSPLHWIVADQSSALTLEPTAQGLKIYENPIGILTNNPPFDYQMTHLTDYLNLTADYPADRFADGLLSPYSRGMGAMGLPGDWSSASRFVRAAFAKKHSPADGGISSFFHCMDAVSVPEGVALSKEGTPIITRYTCCCDPAAGRYYYTTYENRRITAVSLEEENLDAARPISYSLIKEESICFQKSLDKARRL